MKLIWKTCLQNNVFCPGYNVLSYFMIHYEDINEYEL